MKKQALHGMALGVAYGHGAVQIYIIDVGQCDNPTSIVQFVLFSLHWLKASKLLAIDVSRLLSDPSQTHPPLSRSHACLAGSSVRLSPNRLHSLAVMDCS